MAFAPLTEKEIKALWAAIPSTGLSSNVTAFQKGLKSFQGRLREIDAEFAGSTSISPRPKNSSMFPEKDATVYEIDVINKIVVPRVEELIKIKIDDLTKVIDKLRRVNLIRRFKSYKLRF